jgi:hypothetical protein
VVGSGRGLGCTVSGFASAIKGKLSKHLGQHDSVEIRTDDLPNKTLYIFYVWQVTKLVM